MKYYFLTIVSAFVLINPSIYTVFGTATTPGMYSQECSTWDLLDQSLEAEDNMEINCQKNPLCTGIDCTGQYSYTGLITALQKFTVGVCTGLSLLPCSDPLQLYVYTEIPSQHVNFSQHFTHTQLVQIDGASFDASPFGRADSFLQVDMNSTKVFEQNYVKLGIKMKIRLTIGGGFSVQWPEDMQVTIVPDTLIPVPKCQPSIHLHPHPKASCDPTAGLPTPGPHPTTTHAPGPQTKCRPDEMGTCKNHQICKKTDDKNNGVCVCVPEARYNRTTRGCDSKIPHTSPAIIYLTTTAVAPVTKGLSKDVIIIIGASLTGVALLIALVIVVVVKYRRYRSQYANHVLLLASQDNDAEDEAT